LKKRSFFTCVFIMLIVVVLFYYNNKDYKYKSFVIFHMQLVVELADSMENMNENEMIIFLKRDDTKILFEKINNNAKDLESEIDADEISGSIALKCIADTKRLDMALSSANKSEEISENDKIMVVEIIESIISIAEVYKSNLEKVT